MPPDPLPVFVISLPDCVDRRDAISKSLTELCLTFEFVEAVDGRAGLPDEAMPKVNRPLAARHMGRPISDAECAASLSHASVYQRMVDEDLPHALILEDDAIITPGVARFVEQGGFHAAPMVILNHLNARVMPEGETVLFDDVRARPLAVPCFRAAAYSLSLDGARWLLDHAFPVTTPPDWPADITRIGAVVLDPEIVHHPPETPGQSTLSPGRTQRPGQRLHRFLDPQYVRRLWRKARSERIS